MQHFRISVATRNGDSAARRTLFARGREDTLAAVAEHLARARVVGVTVRPCSERDFIRGTRPND